ncbi:MAG TPA: trypsin-like peptidase domain-containing protein [Gemmatimonadales bacterium]|nr:trypsin-like peptidase domain-containing protein [Gemmatimonadales bacterium]
MSGVLESLSNELATVVATAGGGVVAIHARRRIPASGVHWRPGVIVATHHTIHRDDDITVTLPDGATVPATLAGRDPTTDLAVLKVAASGLPSAKLGDTAPPRVGQLVVTLGRPGSNLTASWGVVSSVTGPWRTSRGGELAALIRLDVGIYDGFSGGPLVDAGGRVLGINTSGLARGAAITIPVATVEPTIAELLERGTIRRAYLGVGLQPVRVPQSLGVKLALSSDVALLVVSIAPGGPAERDGLLIGDVLLDVEGTPLGDPSDLLAQLGGDRVGKALTTRVIRGGQMKTLQVTVGERPESRAA